MQAIRTKSFITTRNTNSTPKLVKLQNSVSKCCKIRKICGLRSLRIFYNICVTHRKGRQSLPHLRRFCKKICNFINFRMFFLAVVKVQSFCSYCLDQNLVYQSLSWNCLLKPKYNHIIKIVFAPETTRHEI